MNTKSKEKTAAEIILALGLHYVGRNGAHLTGIPARNLSPEDVQALTKKQIDECLDSGLYKAGHREEVNHES